MTTILSLKQHKKLCVFYQRASFCEENQISNIIHPLEAVIVLISVADQYIDGRYHQPVHCYLLKTKSDQFPPYVNL